MDFVIPDILTRISTELLLQSLVKFPLFTFTTLFFAILSPQSFRFMSSSIPSSAAIRSRYSCASLERDRNNFQGGEYG